MRAPPVDSSPNDVTPVIVCFVKLRHSIQTTTSGRTTILWILCERYATLHSVPGSQLNHTLM